MTITIASTGAPTLVNTNQSSQQMRHTMTALPDGGYVIVWQDFGAMGTFTLQRYDAEGAKVGAETPVMAPLGGDTPIIGGLANGNLLIMWNELFNVKAQVITSGGATIGDPFTVNTTTSGNQASPVMAGLPGGGYVIAWTSLDQDGSGMGVYAQRFNSAGALVGGEFRVNTATALDQTNPAIASLSDGGFVVTWQSTDQDEAGGRGIYAQRYNASGVAVGGETRVNTLIQYEQLNPAVTGLPGGGYVVTWQHFSQTGSGYDVMMQRFDVAGAKVVGEVRVNTSIADYEINPSVAALADGGFVVTWTQHFGEANLFSQRFNSAGVPVGLETTIATGATMAPEEANPIVLGLAGGGYVVSWIGYDSSAYGVYQSRLGSRTDGVLSTDVETATGDGANDEFLAAAGVLSAGDRIDGGGGADRVRMTSAGTLDFRDVLLTSVEQITGSSGADTLIFDEAPAGIAFNSGGGTDTLLLGESTSLGALNLTGSWRVGGVAGSSITLTATTAAQLAMVDGSQANVTVDASTLTLTAEQRAALFAQGVDYVVESGGRTFAADGWANRAGAVSSTAFAGQIPDIAALTGGGFAAASSSGVQMFDAAGNPVRQFAVTASNLGSQDAVIAALNGGGFVVTWVEHGIDGDASAIRAQVFDAGGVALAAAFTVNGSPGGSQLWPSVDGLANGGFVIAWETQNGGASAVQRFSATGVRQGPEGTFNTSPGQGVSVAALDGGGHVVVVQSDGTRALLYDANGARVGGDIVVDSAGWFGQVARLTGGRFAVVWGEQFGGSGNDYHLTVQIFDAAGNRVGAEIPLDSEQNVGAIPAIAGTADGGFVVSWGLQESATSTGLATQRFGADGERVGEPVIRSGPYSYPGLTPLPGGGFAAVWGENFNYRLQITSAIDYHQLTTGANTVNGNATDTLVVVGPGTLNAGDVVTGGLGADVLEMSASGTLDLTAPTTLSGFETILGASGNDVFLANAARLAGVNVIDGRGGNDTLSFATSTTGISGVGMTLTSIETVIGSAFADTLTGDGVANVISGGQGGDTLSGMGGNDTLNGDAGDDVLRGGAGADVIAGGDGIDTADYSAAAAGMRAQLNTNVSSNDGDGGTDTFSSIENLTGSAFNDTLIGDGNVNVLKGGLGADTLLGLGGNDVLWGGAGAANTLQGGLGDDRYVVEAGDSVIEAVGEGTDTVEARVAAYTLSANVENLVFGGVGNFTGTGNAGANTITGGAGDDNLRGRGGVDVLNGGDGVDTADYTLAAAGVTARLDLNRATNDGDGATDTFTGVENLTGSNFNDLLIGNAGNNVLMGGIGTDTLLGFAGDDVLMGGSGGGNNQLQGGQGNDWYILDAFDTCVELAGEGIDTVEARIGSYTLGANIENLLYTGPGGFTGSGNALNNAITGGGQNDILKGGGGDDVINGGLGSDEVQFRGSKAQYTVTVEGSGYRIVDSVAGRDGSTLVSSIEMLRFLTGNTTTALVYPPVAPAALETVDKDAGPLVSLIMDDQPVVLPALQAKAFEDGPQVLPGVEDSKMALRALFDLHDDLPAGPHALYLQPEPDFTTTDSRDWM